MDVKELYENLNSYMGKTITMQGWIRNHRKQKEFGFIDLSDGTYFKHVQLVYDNKLKDFDEIAKLKNGSSIEVNGVVSTSSGKGQSFEVAVKTITLL